MRKGTLAIGALVVLGGGYLAAQGASSYLFERELERTLEDLNTRGDLDAERRDAQRGWFSSQGELVVTPTTGEDWRVTLPYTAQHGLLTTRLEGDFALSLGEDEKRLFGDLLPAAPPRWHAEYQTLSGEVDGRLNLAAFESQEGEARFASQGGELRLAGQRGDLTLTGEIAPWSYSGEDEAVEAGTLTIDSHYRYGEDGSRLEQRDDLSLESLSLHPADGPALDLEALGYEGEVDLGEEELRLASRVSLGEVRIDGQPVLAGDLSLALSRLDADAARELTASLQQELEASGGRLEDLEPEQQRALLIRLEPLILALLADSPRLDLEELRLRSDMLEMQSRLEGELTFDGEDVTDLSLDDLDGKAAKRWLSRLDGHFTWQEVPAMVLMQLGLPLDTPTLEIAIDAGRVTLNGRPLPPLF